MTGSSICCWSKVSVTVVGMVSWPERHSWRFGSSIGSGSGTDAGSEHPPLSVRSPAEYAHNANHGVVAAQNRSSRAGPWGQMAMMSSANREPRFAISCSLQIAGASATKSRLS